MSRDNQDNWGGMAGLSIERLFTAAETEVFRFEHLPVYRITGEWDNFERFLQGEPLPPDSALEDFLAVIRKGVGRGRRHVLVRAIPAVPNDYIHFETEVYYRRRANAGESIRVIDPPDLAAIVADGSCTDFFMFDKRWVYELQYDPEGRFEGERMVENHRVPQFLLLRDRLIERSRPMEF